MEKIKIISIIFFIIYFTGSDFCYSQKNNFKKMENQEVVLAVLKKSSNPLKAGEIAEITGIDKKEVSKVIKQLVNEGKVYSPKFCYYDVK